MYLYVHVEEPSMAEAAGILVPRILNITEDQFRVIDHGSKAALLRDIGKRFSGYARRLENTEDLRILVLVDRDEDDCRVLKQRLEQIAKASGLVSKTRARSGQTFRVVNRIVCEELEAWFLGDVAALRGAYPRVPASLGDKARFRNPDDIRGGTWEALLKVLNDAGYYRGQQRLPKIEVARRVAPGLEIAGNRSASFSAFVNGLRAIMG